MVITVCDNANETCPIFPGESLVKIHKNFIDPTKIKNGEYGNHFIKTRNEIKISIDEVTDTIKEVLNRPNYKTNHLIDFEELSTQERIQILLKILSKRNIITFSKTLQKNEGKKGVVVTLLASLELAKDGYLELIQNKSSELFLKSKGI